MGDIQIDGDGDLQPSFPDKLTDLLPAGHPDRTFDTTDVKVDDQITVGPPDDGHTVDEHLDELVASPKARRSPRLTVVTDSELQTFRSCAQKHHFQYRERLRPLVEAKALAVGSIFHAGMRAGIRAGWSAGWRSRPNTRRLQDQADAATKGIDDLVVAWATKIVAHAADVDFEKLQTEVDDTAAMVKWMLRHYFDRTQADLASLVLVEVETPFEVPIHDRIGRVSPHLRYAGVRDAVFFDVEFNQIVLMEHKTSGGNPQDIEKRVEMDTQTAGYLYALKQQKPQLKTVDGHPLGDALLGRVIYNVLKKALPRPPNVNKDGSVSVAACTTTPEMYRDALNAQVKQRNIPTSTKQAEFLQRLVDQGDPFFARVEYHRTKAEIERWRSDTFVDAARIRGAERNVEQRTRNTGHCNMPWSLPCPYRQVCLDPGAPEIRKQFRVAEDPHTEVRDAEAGEQPT